MTTVMNEIRGDDAGSAVIGLIAHTCATVRFAAELWISGPMIRDADYSDALDVNIPNYASAAVTTAVIVDAIYTL